MGIWLGRKRIPPLPNETVLTDRSDGSLYRVVKSNGTPGVSAASTPINTNKNWVYQAYEGPVMADDEGKSQRLYVDSGTLGFEAAAKHERHPPVYTIENRRPLEVWKVVITSGALSMEKAT